MVHRGPAGDVRHRTTVAKMGRNQVYGVGRFAQQHRGLQRHVPMTGPVKPIPPNVILAVPLPGHGVVICPGGQCAEKGRVEYRHVNGLGHRPHRRLDTG